jgi:hypothetical protein
MKSALFAAAALASLTFAVPASAEEVGVRVGPVGGGVTVGEGHDRDRDRDRTVIREREPERDRTVIIKKDHDRDRDRDPDRKVIIDRN